MPTFEDWFTTIALPHLKRLSGKKVMIGDNLSSHLSAQVIKSCEENNISFVFLPPRSTQFMQPLDVSFFAPSSVARGGRGAHRAPPHWLVKYAKSHFFVLLRPIFGEKLKTAPPKGNWEPKL